MEEEHVKVQVEVEVEVQVTGLHSICHAMLSSALCLEYFCLLAYSASFFFFGYLPCGCTYYKAISRFYGPD